MPNSQRFAWSKYYKECEQSKQYKENLYAKCKDFGTYDAADVLLGIKQSLECPCCDLPHIVGNVEVAGCGCTYIKCHYFKETNANKEYKCKRCNNTALGYVEKKKRKTARVQSDDDSDDDDDVPIGHIMKKRRVMK